MELPGRFSRAGLHAPLGDLGDVVGLGSGRGKETVTTQAAQSAPQGDELEQLLDQLDQANQSADPLNDLPQ
jgi:hypothetical protein